MKTQEQSSISKEEVPKIKEGLLDKYEKEPVKEVTKESTKDGMEAAVKTN